MTYLEVLTDICSQVADPGLDTYKERAKDHFLRSIAKQISEGNYNENDIPGFIKTKANMKFAGGSEDINSLKVFEILDLYLPPGTDKKVIINFQETSELNKISSIETLQPTINDLFIYREGNILKAYTKDEITLAGESLDEVDFATHAEWAVTNDLDDTGGNAAFTWSANQTSTLTQLQASLVIAGVADKFYKFTYTIAETTAFDGDGAAIITTAFALTAVDLDLTPGTHTVYFKSAAAPTDFVISIVSGTDTEGTFTIDDVSLKEITAGDYPLFVLGTDILTMKYIEDIDDNAWTDATDLQAAANFQLSYTFTRESIRMAAKTLRDEVQL